MDLGLSSVLAPILEFFNSFIGNFGVSVMVLTILIKTIILPLDMKQRRMTRRMSELQPKLQAINKKYANDAEKRNQKTAELYRKEKINPLSGCLPLLVTWPVLIALFMVLRNIADQELLHMYNLVTAGDWEGFESLMSQSQFLWIRNIWQPDSFISPHGEIFPQSISAAVSLQELKDIPPEAYQAMLQAIADRYGSLYMQTMHFDMILWPSNGLFILPIVTAAGQFFQTKLMSKHQTAVGPNGKPRGRWMQYLFPLLTLFLCATYNAAFAIYWFTSAAYSIIQYALSDYLYKRKQQQIKLDQEQEWGKLGQ